jgi:membrane protease YdiL (CAAX protease family)
MLGVLVSSVLFGVAHTGHGLVGAAILPQRFNNTLEFITFFAVGAVDGLG